VTTLFFKILSSSPTLTTVKVGDGRKNKKREGKKKGEEVGGVK
jgi:hypothetical protein